MMRCAPTLAAKAHTLWKALVKPGDLVIDATIGNGHDTLFLASLLKNQGQLIGYDVQKEALAETTRRTKGFSNIFLKQASHNPIVESGAALIVYNLGYLPGSDKRITTRTEETLCSLQSAIKALKPNGSLSITCYPGHEEGKRESAAVMSWALEQKGQLTIYPSRSPFLILLTLVP